jgi:hypothetical protein
MNERSTVILPAAPGTNLYAIHYPNDDREPETIVEVLPVIGWRESTEKSWDGDEGDSIFFEPVVPLDQPRLYGVRAGTLFVINTPDGKYREVASDGDWFETLDDARDACVTRVKRAQQGELTDATDRAA